MTNQKPTIQLLSNNLFTVLMRLTAFIHYKRDSVLLRRDYIHPTVPS